MAVSLDCLEKLASKSIYFILDMLPKKIRDSVFKPSSAQMEESILPDRALRRNQNDTPRPNIDRIVNRKHRNLIKEN